MSSEVVYGELAGDSLQVLSICFVKADLKVSKLKLPLASASCLSSLRGDLGGVGSPARQASIPKDGRFPDSLTVTGDPSGGKTLASDGNRLDTALVYV